MQNTGGSGINMAGPDSGSRIGDQSQSLKSKQNSRTYQNQSNSNVKKRLNNESGDEAFADHQGFSSNRETQLEERTQLEVENT